MQHSISTEPLIKSTDPTRFSTIEDSGSGRQKARVRIGKQAGDVVLEGNGIKAVSHLLDERQKP